MSNNINLDEIKVDNTKFIELAINSFTCGICYDICDIPYETFCCGVCYCYKCIENIKLHGNK